jgi:hypothetical protein
MLPERIAHCGIVGTKAGDHGVEVEVSRVQALLCLAIGGDAEAGIAEGLQGLVYG